jgi:hypothetical protein
MTGSIVWFETLKQLALSRKTTLHSSPPPRIARALLKAAAPSPGSGTATLVTAALHCAARARGKLAALRVYFRFALALPDMGEKGEGEKMAFGFLSPSHKGPAAKSEAGAERRDAR